MIEIDGTERLQEVSDTLEDREIQVEHTRCACGEHIKTVRAQSLSAEWWNVSLAEECMDEAISSHLDRVADYIHAERRLAG